MKKGDVITRINDANINSWTELQGTVASYNAGDKIKITYKRDGKEYNAMATLSTKTGTFDEVASSSLSEKLGAELETIDKKKADKYSIDGGIVIKSIKKDSPLGRTRMQEGFIITSVNGMDVSNTEELSRALSSLKGESIQLEGIYPGYEGVYRYPLNLDDE